MAVKAIYFDIGGVLLSNGWGHMARNAAVAQFGLDAEDFNYRHHFVFDLHQTGRISLDQYLDTTVFYKPRSFDKQSFIKFMEEQSSLLPKLLDELIAWKKGKSVKIYSLNNEGKELNQYRIRHFELHRLFDGFVSSCDVGLLKPDPALYPLALGIGQIEAEEALYFDDRQILVDAASAAGMQGRLHSDATDTMNFLKGLDVD